MNKVLILDMDGTCREPGSGGQFIQHPLDQKIIAGADTALARYHDEGWLAFGITNQGGVAALKKSLNDCIQEQYQTLKLLPQIHKIYFCPDFEGRQLGCAYPSQWSKVFAPRGYSSFRKPGSGMIEYVLATHTIDELLFVGDRPEDEQAASGAEVAFMWADAWRSHSN